VQSLLETDWWFLQGKGKWKSVGFSCKQWEKLYPNEGSVAKNSNIEVKLYFHVKDYKKAKCLFDNIQI
jgi:hypothetical protein